MRYDARIVQFDQINQRLFLFLRVFLVNRWAHVISQTLLIKKHAIFHAVWVKQKSYDQFGCIRAPNSIPTGVKCFDMVRIPPFPARNICASRMKCVFVWKNCLGYACGSVKNTIHYLSNHDGKQIVFLFEASLEVVMWHYSTSKFSQVGVIYTQLGFSTIDGVHHLGMSIMESFSHADDLIPKWCTILRAMLFHNSGKFSTGDGDDRDKSM